MVLIFNEIISIETKDEMLISIGKCKLGCVLIGENAQQYNKFYCLKGYLLGDRSNCFSIGIISEGHGLAPECLVVGSKNVILVGSDKTVYVIDYLEKKISQSIPLDSLFYHFVSIVEFGIVLIVHETGIIAMNSNLKVIWVYSSDIICKHEIDGSLIKLSFFEDKPVELSIFDGTRQNIL